MDAETLRKILDSHQKWLNGEGGERADLRGANLDFSCWPLWCGSKGVKVDAKIARQLMLHVLSIECDDPEFKKISRLKSVRSFAAQSHRAKDMGFRN